MTEGVEASWPTMPRGALRIFRCADPEVTERAAGEEAERFGLRVGSRFGATRFGAEKVTYAQAQQEVTVYRGSGGVRYRDLTRWQLDSGAAVDLGDDDAVAIARSFVERHELAPLAECRLDRVTRLRVGLVDRDATTAEERVIDLGVIFRRVIDEVPADGPGGHVMVYIGADGEVTGADRIWRAIADVDREVETLRPREWLEERLRRRGPDARSRLEVHQIRLGYFEHGWRTRQEFLQPAYVVLGTIRSLDERLHRRTVYAAPAATNDAGEIMPLDKEVRRQSPRTSG
jgi:hypothetical protein